MVRINCSNDLRRCIIILNDSAVVMSVAYDKCTYPIQSLLILSGGCYVVKVINILFICEVAALSQWVCLQQ